MRTLQVSWSQDLALYIFYTTQGITARVIARLPDNNGISRYVSLATFITRSRCDWLRGFAVQIINICLSIVSWREVDT